MSQNKILIFGGNGWIGSKVYDLLELSKIEVHKSNCRANNFVDVQNEINDVKPTHIMSFIGRTHGTYNGETIGTIDYLEKPGRLVENINDNLYSPILLADLCKKNGIHFTYLGTGCIFDYDDDHPYGNETTGFLESDQPNFFGSSYSIVKGFTDRMMHELYNDTALNVRIRMPITDELNSKRNFITKIINYERICSIPNSMTVLNDLLPIMIDMALNRETGTVNLVNPGLITHNEMLEMYKEIVDPEFKWVNFTIEEQNNVLQSKRSNNYLDTSLLERYAKDKNYRLMNIRESVRNILSKMKME